MSKRPAPPTEAPPMRVGLHVVILAPHAMQGKAGVIAGPIQGQDSWHVKLVERGWMSSVPTSQLQTVRYVPPRYPPAKARPAELAFTPASTSAPIPSQNLLDAKSRASASLPAVAVTTESTTPPETTPADESESTFTSGQRVFVSPSGPLLGNQGTILGPIGGFPGYKVRMDRGMIVFMETSVLQDAGASVSQDGEDASSTVTCSSATEMPVPTDMPTP